MQGLFDQGVLKPSTEEEAAGYRFISSKVVRLMKRGAVKSRLVLRDIARSAPEGGELFASTPALASLRTLIAVASGRRHTAAARGEPPHGCLTGDVGQAFIHAKIDKPIVTRVPKSLDGLTLQYEGREITLSEGDWLLVLMALYGYRKSPRLYQDYFVKITKNGNFNRSVVDPSVFWKEGVLLLVHVDDLIIFGEMKLIESIFDDFREHLKLREEGRLQKPGDEAGFLGRTLKMTEDGYAYHGSEKIVAALLKQLGLEKAKAAVTPAVKGPKKDHEPLTVEQASNYRGALGKLLYIAHDNPGVQYAAGNAARACSAPTELEMQRVVRAARYLRGTPLVQ